MTYAHGERKRRLLHQQDQQDPGAGNPQGRELDPARVEQRDHDDRSQIVDHGEGEQQMRKAGGTRFPEQRQSADRKRDCRSPSGAPSRLRPACPR
jgi:hypothetical protein